ncbi:hypothetical protein Gotur_005614 [Gossypium turneri]
MLFKKAEPITTNSTDLRWKWFKDCLGALEPTSRLGFQKLINLYIERKKLT